MKLVLDASVAIKLYAPEPDSDLALEVVEANAPFLVPDIFLVEVAQALLRHHRERRLSANELMAAVSEVASLVDEHVSSSRLIDRGLAMAHALDHRLHDCLYLALAEMSGRPLLTADDRLIRKVRDRGVPAALLSPTEITP